MRSERDWFGVLANTARVAVEKGDFRSGLDCEQFAHDLYWIIYAYCHTSRLMREPRARARAEAAFEALVNAARPAAPGENSRSAMRRAPARAPRRRGRDH